MQKFQLPVSQTLSRRGAQEAKAYKVHSTTRRQRPEKGGKGGSNATVHGLFCWVLSAGFRRCEHDRDKSPQNTTLADCSFLDHCSYSVCLGNRRCAPFFFGANASLAAPHPVVGPSSGTDGE